VDRIGWGSHSYNESYWVNSLVYRAPLKNDTLQSIVKPGKKWQEIFLKQDIVSFRLIKIYARKAERVSNSRQNEGA
jgi:hypothetical protein